MASIYFSNGNTLLPTTDKYIVRIFNLPAISIRDDHGNINKDCPNICLEAPGICKEICYAYKRQSGKEKIVYGRRKENYDASQQPDFVDSVIKLISGTVKYYSNKDVKIIYRIHESGDYYSIDYLHKWVQIAEHFKLNSKIIFMSYTKNIELLNSYLLREGKTLNDVNIKFKYSVMELSEYDGSVYTKTSDYPNKLLIANNLRKQGLTFYSLYSIEEEMPKETTTHQHCVLGTDGETCATCEMKCYLKNVDISSVARL